MLRVMLGVAFVCGMVFAQAAPAATGKQPSFEVASVKPSQSVAGHDGNITTDPGKFTARNTTLKRLIFEAYRIPYSQITRGPSWLDSDEYDVDAKAESPATADQLDLMLRKLLADRFKLAIRRETRDGRVYVLVAGRDGPKLSGSGAKEGQGSLVWRFHGDLSEFAARLALQLTIPMDNPDPSSPSRATGTPVPVINKTGIEGIHDISVALKPEPGADTFTVWQRALQEQLGLRLESQKAPVEILVIEHAEKIPAEN